MRTLSMNERLIVYPYLKALNLDQEKLKDTLIGIHDTMSNELFDKDLEYLIEKIDCMKPSAFEQLKTDAENGRLMAHGRYTYDD